MNENISNYKYFSYYHFGDDERTFKKIVLTLIVILCNRKTKTARS